MWFGEPARYTVATGAAGSTICWYPNHLEALQHQCRADESRLQTRSDLDIRDPEERMLGELVARMACGEPCIIGIPETVSYHLIPTSEHPFGCAALSLGVVRSVQREPPFTGHQAAPCWSCTLPQGGHP